ASVKLFGWQGNSGPVVADASGNVFVAGFIPGGAYTDAIYAVTKAQTLAQAAVTKATLSEQSTGGTASIAALMAQSSPRGGIVAKGHDNKQAMPGYAIPYRTSGGAIV